MPNSYLEGRDYRSHSATCSWMARLLCLGSLGLILSCSKPERVGTPVGGDIEQSPAPKSTQDVSPSK
jgi:hypothetical protein